ncbi:MAG: DNA primase noncatalytic subunit PriX [Desulfurococcaceae archaeon]
MGNLDLFIEYLREYFRGSTGQAEYRELFICRGDPASSRNKSRGVVWLHGLDTYLTTFVKSTRGLREWNIYMGVGFVVEPGLTSPVLEKTLYDRLSFDFDSEEDPDTAVSQALSFAGYLNNRYSTTPIVFESGFKGAHVVVPLSKPVVWEVYQLLWKKLYGEMVVDQRKLVDANMLQWNRVDRVPLTYNVKENDARFCRIIYPREFSWEDFNWVELKTLDPSSIRLVRIVVPQVVKPRVITASAGKRSWVWRVVEKGLSDGRKRFILHVLVPYLVNACNKSEDDVLEVCRTFLDNSCRNFNNCSKVYDSWIRSVIRSAKAHSFRGFGLSKLKEKDPELYKLISEALSAGAIHGH